MAPSPGKTINKFRPGDIKTMKAGFIGFGTLGSTIAKRLSENGVEITGWNRTIEKVKKVGVRVAESPKAVVEENEITFLCLSDSNAVREVIRSISGSLRGKIIVDLTTNHFKDVLEFHEVVSDEGGYYLESPVLGSVVPASKGELTVVVSGDESAYAKAHRYLEIIGKKIYFVREPGKATKIKLVNNLVLGAFMGAIAESLSLAERCGIEKTLMIDVLENGAGKSLVLAAKKEKLLNEDFSVHFSVWNMHKDLKYLIELSESVGAPTPISSIAKELYKTALKDYGNEDFSIVYRLLKEV